MTLAYVCSKCGTPLQTSNADPLLAEIDRLKKMLKFALAVLEGEVMDKDYLAGELAKLQSATY